MKAIEADTSLPAARVIRVLERLIEFRDTYNDWQAIRDGIQQ
jgi:hypothetical protein